MKNIVANVCVHRLRKAGLLTREYDTAEAIIAKVIEKPLKYSEFGKLLYDTTETFIKHDINNDQNRDVQIDNLLNVYQQQCARIQQLEIELLKYKDD